MRDIHLSIQQGDKFLKRCEYKNAIEKFQKVLEADPKNIEVYLKLAHCYCKVISQTAGIELLEKALQIASDDYRIYLQLAEFYLGRTENLMAVEYYKKAFSLKPNNLFILLKIGQTLNCTNRFGDSQQYLSKYLDEISTDSYAYYLQGENYYSLKEYSTALKFYLKAKDTDSSSNDIIDLCIGQTFYMLGSYHKALEYLMTSLNIRLNEEYFDISEETFFLALCYLKTNDKNELRKLYNNYIELNTGNKYVSFLALGNHFMNIEDWKNAIMWYQKAIECSPDQPAAYEYMSSCYYKLGMIDKGLKVCLKAVSNNNKDESAYYILASFYQRIKDYDKAIEALDTAIQLDESYIFYYVSKAEIYYKQKEYKKAIKELEKAIHVDLLNDEPHTNFWNNDRIVFLYSDCHYQISHFEKALTILLHGMQEKCANDEEQEETCIRLENPVLWEKLCRIYFQLNNYQQCLESAKKLIWLDHTNLIGQLYKILILYKQNDIELAEKHLKVLSKKITDMIRAKIADNDHFKELLELIEFYK